MPRRSRRSDPDRPDAPPASAEQEPPKAGLLPMMIPPTSQFAEVAHGAVQEPEVPPKSLERGLIAFDLDGTLLDDIGLISHVAADELEKAFGTPAEEGRVHYLATTGMPFEAQLAQLYPTVPADRRAAVARSFHARKVREAYALAHPFPEIPRVLKRLSVDRWTLAVSTGAEREMADLVLEREGIRFWFEAVLGSGQGTKREHLAEFRRRYPGAPIVLVGDSRFDMEAAAGAKGVVAVGRASAVHGWTLTPDDLRRWGARWADYRLSELPEALPSLLGAPDRPRPPARGRRKGRDRESPKAGDGPASV